MTICGSSTPGRFCSLSLRRVSILRRYTTPSSVTVPLSDTSRSSRVGSLVITRYLREVSVRYL